MSCETLCLLANDDLSKLHNSCPLFSYGAHVPCPSTNVRSNISRDPHTIVRENFGKDVRLETTYQTCAKISVTISWASTKEYNYIVCTWRSIS